MAMQGEWVALCTVVSAATAEEMLWFHRARRSHGGVARCLQRIAALPLQLKVKANFVVARPIALIGPALLSVAGARERPSDSARAKLRRGSQLPGSRARFVRIDSAARPQPPIARGLATTVTLTFQRAEAVPA